jgi:hypothetical protein
MSSRSPRNRGRRFLARHLSRLSDSLETLGALLRDAVAAAVGQAVADAVREAARAALAGPGHGPGPDRPRWDAPPAASAWDRPHRPDDGSDSPRVDPDAAWPPEDETPGPEARPGRQGARPRALRAVAVGLEASAWWLRRCAGRWCLGAAAAVGLAAALAAYALGAWARAGVGLAGSALSLLSRSATSRAGDETPDGFGIR